MGLFNARYTKEEKEEFEKVMLEMIPKGAFMTEIAERLGIGENDVQRLKNKLINERKTSQDKIDKAVEERRDREKIERLLTDPDIQKVKEGLLAGLSHKKISESVRFSRSRIGQLEKILEEAGIVDKKQREIARESRKNEKKEKQNEVEEMEMTPSEYLDKERFVLRLLNIGISTRQIRNITGITLKTFKQMKAELIDEGETSDELIKKAIEERERSSKDIIETYIKQGYNCVEIAEKIPYADSRFVERLAKELKAEGRVTDEDIIAGKAKREAELDEFVKRELENGFICEEIAETEEAKALKLTGVSIRNRMNKLKSSGAITKEDEERFKRARKTMQEAKKTNEFEPYDKKFIILTELGFNSKEIRRVTGISKTYFFKRKKVLEGMGLMKEGKKAENTIALVRKREKMADTRREAIEKMISFDRDIDSSIVNNHIEYAKAMFGLGQVESKDIELISIAIPMEYDLMSLGNINFVIKYFNERDCLKQGVSFINRCLESANDEQDKKRWSVNEYKSYFRE